MSLVQGTSIGVLHGGGFDSPRALKGGCANSTLPPKSRTMMEAFCAAPIALSHGLSSVERPIRDGVSGAYIIRHNTRNVPLAVFKPKDEEVSDQKDVVLRDFSRGSGAAREVAAYLLDRGEFAGVPETSLASVKSGARDVQGMLQVYVENEGDADDFGPSVFDEEDVQKIATFDIRIMNADRHGGNLLVSRSGSRFGLRPIDHGLVLPTTLRTLPWPVWMNWPQVKQPMTEKVREYIANLDAERDAEMLKTVLGDQITEEALKSLRCGTTLLQIGAVLGMSLYDIGLLLFSVDMEETSLVQQLLPIKESVEEIVSVFLNFPRGVCMTKLEGVLRQVPDLLSIVLEHIDFESADFDLH